jgi:glucose/arabinose dehydrogenase
VALTALLAAAFAYFAGVADARVPRGFGQGQLVGGFSRPTAMAVAPDGRIFVAQQGGQVRVVENGRLLPAPFARVNTDSRGERGLIGITLDPDFENNGFVYVYYTATRPRVHNRVARFTANGNVATSPEQPAVIFEINNLSSRTNHNGGAMQFGADGKLYVAVGDNAYSSTAQSLGELKGKILRINPDGTIPQDNPYYSPARGRTGAIWARGLRNPYTIDIQRGTNRLYINDVGARTWEEINAGSKAANYGWSRFEGPDSSSRYVGPIYAYRHGNTATTGCAITGGAFYDPPQAQFPSSYAGDYFFADFCNGWIRRYEPARDRATSFATTGFGTVDLDVAPDGSLLYLSRGTDSIGRIRYTAGG